MAQATTPPPGTRKTLIHRQLLGPGLYQHTVVRLLVALGTVVGALFARSFIGIEGLDVGALVVLGVIIMAYDGVAWVLVRRHREREESPEVLARLALVMHASIVLDLLALTVAIWLVGGARSPFLVFFLLHVILAYVNLSRRAAIIFSLIAYGLLALLVAGDYHGFMPSRLPIGAVASTAPLDPRYALTILAVFAVLFGLLGFFLSSIIWQLRQAESRIRLANAELWRLSNIRRDFLHIAMHNIRSPVGAVSMFLKNLREGLTGPVTDKQKETLDRCLSRLDGLSVFLGDMQAFSEIEAGIIKAEFANVEVLPILESIVEEYREMADQHRHMLILDVPRSLPPVLANRRLLREAIVNFVTNAIRYTPDGGVITIRAWYSPPSIHIEVEDTGVGITPADQARLFQEFVRLDRRGTPVARVEGSGLGLSIVKKIVEAFGGTVSVKSQLGKGSIFAVDLPEAQP